MREPSWYLNLIFSLRILSAGGLKYLNGSMLLSNHWAIGVVQMGILAKHELTCPLVWFVSFVKTDKLYGLVSSMQFDARR